MKAREILQELQANRTEFSRILKDPTIKFGFECEMFVEVNVDDGGGSPQDPDEMSWHELTQYLDMSSRDRREVEEAFDEFISQKITSAWDEEKRSYTRKWCEANGYLPDPDVEDEDEVIDEHIVSAFNDWMDEEADSIRSDYDMDGFISEEHGSNSAFVRYLSIQPEYGWDDDGNIYTEDSRKGDVSDYYPDIAEQISEALGVTVSQRPYDDEEWEIVEDGSLDDNWSDDHVPCEIVSSVYQIGAGIEKLTALFDWMSGNAETTGQTGLHINLSLEGYDASDYDFFKMAVLFDENYTASIFSRINNRYALQMRNRILGVLKNEFKVPDEGQLDPREVMDGNSLAEVLAALKKMGSSISGTFGKYSSIKNRGDGVFEFRGMGGKGYHTKGDAIRKQIVHMANILIAGADDEAYVKEYLTKVAQMIGNGKFANPKLGSGQNKEEKLPDTLAGLAGVLRGRPLLARAAAERPVAFLRALGIALFQRAITLTPPQKGYLRVYIRRNGINPESFRTEIRNDDAYNQIARFMGWTMALPKDDERQQALPFVSPGTASRAPQPVTDPEDLSLDQRLAQPRRSERDVINQYHDWRNRRDMTDGRG